MKLRPSLAAVVALVLVVVVAPEATGKGAGGIPQATSNIPAVHRNACRGVGVLLGACRPARIRRSTSSLGK